MQHPEPILHSFDFPLENQLNEESSELAKFRAEWKAEVDRRRQLPESGSSAQFGAAPKPHVEQAPLFNRPASRVTAGVQSTTATSSASKASHPAIRNGVVLATSSPDLGKALAIYRRAVQYEQNGDLDAALTSYRQAFRLDAHVDRAFHREELLHAKLQSYTEKVPGLGTTSPTTDQLASEFQQLSVKHTTQEPTSALGQSSVFLSQIIASFPQGVRFEPEDERFPVILNDLPAEIIYMVIRKMNVASVERFARVCRKARILTLDPVYWSELVRATYKPPQLPALEDLLPIVQDYKSNLRRLFIEHPRVRMDGIYIAICHYTRPGLSENSWVNINHLITYHRYLRFYPNGQVLSLLANEEMSPQQVIPILKPTLRMKGFFIGNWYLTGTILNIVNLMDASGKYLVPGHDMTTLASDFSSIGLSRPSPPGADTTPVQPVSIFAPPASTSIPTHSHPYTAHGRGGHHGQGHPHGHGHLGGSGTAPPAQIRYVFDMSLNLRSKPLGRWNKLDMVTYDSVNLETGEVHAVPLKHERPFWFSKVRSYS